MLSITLGVEKDRLINAVQRTVAVPVSCIVIENDPDLVHGYIIALVDWGTGERQTFSGSGTLTVDTQRALAPGNYHVGISAYNYRHPTPDIAFINIAVEVVGEEPVAPPTEFIYGPILPRDAGPPDKSQWNFNRGVDIGILESSVKMLLITKKGERVMEPAYGTNLSRAIFEPDTDSARSIIQEEIMQAIQQFEPRVALSSFSIFKKESKEIGIDITFISVIGGNKFSLPLNFSL